MPHRQPAVQSFQDLHRRPGIAGAFRTWQQLDGVQLEPNRVVHGHFPAVLEAQDLFQAQLRVNGGVKVGPCGRKIAGYRRLINGNEECR